MPIRSNLHTHTIYCDGVSTPREMAEAALANGFVSLGFSGHSYTPYDDCGMSPAQALAYRQEVLALQREYAGRLEIFLGLENDAVAPQPLEGYE
ncbi:MAG: PHP domain-containing protein, partial [Clostridia bacterium]|nr:PHP domain-containing protein [Clostridia bacterium]